MPNPEIPKPELPTESTTTVPPIKLGAFVSRDLVGAPVPTPEEEPASKPTVSEMLEEYGGMRIRAEQSPWL